MFEYGPNGERRLSKFGQRVVVMMILVAMVLAATVYLVAHRQAGESTGGVITAGFALAGTLGMGVLTWGQGRRNEEMIHQSTTILHSQNEKMEEIQGKVGAVEDRVVKVLNEDRRVERHDWIGQLNVANLKRQEAEAKLEAAREQISVLMAQQAKGAKGDQGERGERGEPGTPHI
jgi:hypothetical protein